MTAALPFVAMALSVAGPVIQGIGAARAGKQNQAVAYEAALDEERTMVADLSLMRDVARRDMGEQVAAQWGNGFEGGSGTALDAVKESQINAALDAMERRRQGLSRANALREEGDIARREGKFALASGILTGASKAIGGATDWAQANAGSSRSGSVG
jgi:hypothetical protein